MDGLATERSARYSDAMPNSVSLYLDFFHSYCSVSDTMFIFYFIAPYFFSSRARDIQTYQTTFLFSAFSFFIFSLFWKTFFSFIIYFRYFVRFLFKNIIMNEQFKSEMISFSLFFLSFSFSFQKFNSRN